MPNWSKVLNGDIQFEVLTNVLPTKGNLVYEYNPFRNYRLSQDMLEYKGEYYTQDQLKDEFDIILDGNTWKQNGKDITDQVTLREKGELVDFITDELSFSIKSPVTITPQYSYDGSVNLIINDGVNIPRMINSRFSATGRNTYEIVDRKGNNDTNIYDQGEQFDIDTSLYKRVIKIPKIKFQGVSSGGNLKIGNYHLYFKLSDADGNETDFIGETGLISIFIGFEDPKSITTGQGNENSFKSIKIKISNIDTAYSYVYAYYSRYTAVDQEEFNTEYVKIDKKFVINNSGICNMLITGFEPTIPISAADINLNYNVIDAAYTATSCQNMLFLGNVHKPEIPYVELQDLSLRFLPYLKQENYQMDMDEDYNISTFNKGYYDPQFIHDKTGYWGEEIYRIGIVYIMPNNELSPVFNIRGANNIYNFGGRNIEGNHSLYNDGQFSEFPVWIEKNEQKIRNYIQYNESNYEIIINNENNENSKNNIPGILQNSMENVKGVVRFIPTKDTNTIYGLDIRVSDEVIQELKKYVKGYFFVRQSRIPTILAQGITIGIDQNAFTPCVATADGYLTDLSEQLEKTHVQTKDINDINYVSEGFLSRYKFKFEKKKSGLFKSILTGVAIAAAVVVVAAATVFTCGAAGAALAAGAATSGVIGGAVTAGAAAIGTVCGTIGAAVGLGSIGVAATAGIIAGATIVGTAVTMATLGVIQEVRYGAQRLFATKKLDGRNTKCPSGYKIVETDESRKLTQDFFERIIIKDPSKVKVQAILCPDYEVNQGYYNSIFTGNKHKIGLTITQSANGLVGHTSNYFTNKDRHFYIPSYYDMNIRNSYNFKIIGVPDDVTLTGIDNLKFRSRAGQAEEAWRYECIGDDYKSDYSKSSDVEDEETVSNKQINTDIIRGSFGPYLAFNDENNKFSPAETVNIYIPEYSLANIEKYFSIRMQDNTPFQAISDRYDIKEVDDNLVTPLSIITEIDRSCGYRWELYRGDCYICQFTHRMHRNFCDPGAPYNDEIVQTDTWKDHYKTDEPEQYNEINLGDVNAIQIGTWVTFRVRSSYNLNIRTTDGSDVVETAMCGHPRGYYPYNDMLVEGTYKHPDSQVYNKGFSKSLSERFNMELPDVPYIKNWFETRIMYSDIHINDAYKNGYRVFRPTTYRDYTREYGEIVKLITLESDLICIFEHGVARIPVNRQAVVEQVAAGANQLTTHNVLPEAPIILSDMFGSQWADSVLKTPGKAGNARQYIYGVDTVAKKIWRTDGQSLECISDMRVQEFLNNNITLGERENTPILGIRNVKTCYNSFKRDIMFTFYDNTYGFEEKVWNLCWSELLEKFITFYSWIPAVMEDINNIPFSFDRNVSKWIAKLGVSHADNSFADGITLTNTVINNYSINSTVVNNLTFTFNYEDETGKQKSIIYNAGQSKDAFNATVTNLSGFIGVLGLANRILPDGHIFYTIDYELCRDPWSNYKNFEIKHIGNVNMGAIADSMFKNEMTSGSTTSILYPIYGLFCNSNDNQDSKVMMSELYYRNSAGHSYADYDVNKIKLFADNKQPNTIQNSEDLPIFKDITGRRPMLSRKEQLNPDKIVTLLNITAKIKILDTQNYNNLSDTYYNMKASYAANTSLVSAAQYQSVIGLTTKWNMQFLTSDFWKHGQAGLIDIADDIYPTYWYGKQHPFEFECIVVDDPSLHKIFTNLELVANKAKPESFHYEVVGEAYDFAKDKVNMYFRQEALKALWQYNGADITYDRNFLKVQPRQVPRSADLIHRYYTRQDTINDIEDYYIHITYPQGYNYCHLSGAEIVYYPTRQEFRIWNHVMAADIDDFPLDDTDKLRIDEQNQNNNIFGARALIAGNMRYLEDRWKVTINPILVCYKNEYKKSSSTPGPLISKDNSTWAKAYNSDQKLPSLLIYNSPIPDEVKESGQIKFPGIALDPNNSSVSETSLDRENALYHLYDLSKFGINGNYSPLDTTNWLDDVGIYQYNFGEAHNRKEVDVRDKFIKIRIRYSGEELAIIDFLSTIYQVSYA